MHQYYINAIGETCTLNYYNCICFSYGMRYMAKVLRSALMQKFPEAPEKDVLKVHLNIELLYSRVRLVYHNLIIHVHTFQKIDLTNASLIWSETIKMRYPDRAPGSIQ